MNRPAGVVAQHLQKCAHRGGRIRVVIDNEDADTGWPMPLVRDIGECRTVGQGEQQSASSPMICCQPRVGQSDLPPSGTHNEVCGCQKPEQPCDEPPASHRSIEVTSFRSNNNMAI